MKPLIYKGLRKNLNRSEWVSSDEIKQSYSQIRLLAVENDTYTWVPIEDGTLCRGSEAKDNTGKRSPQEYSYHIGDMHLFRQMHC